MTLPTHPENLDNRDEELSQANSVPKGSLLGGAELKEADSAGEFEVDSVPKGS